MIAFDLQGSLKVADDQAEGADNPHQRALGGAALANGHAEPLQHTLVPPPAHAHPISHSPLPWLCAGS